MSEVFGANAERPGPWMMGEGMGTGPLTKEDLDGAVRHALGRTKNGSTPGPESINYRLIKAVRGMKLVRELIEVVVEYLHVVVIAKPWREIRVVFIPIPGRELTVAKNWRPLNLIKYIGKLREKVVAYTIQNFDGGLFHRMQYGSVRGRLAVDVLYNSVRRAREC